MYVYIYIRMSIYTYTHLTYPGMKLKCRVVPHNFGKEW